MIYCKVLTFVTWVQHKAEPEALAVYVLVFYQGPYSGEQRRNQKSEATKGEQI